MNPTSSLTFLEKVTRRLADTFQELNQLCLEQMRKFEAPPPISEEQKPAFQAPPLEQFDAESPEQVEKESKTKKIKKQGEDKQCEDNKSKKKMKVITNKPKAPASSFLMFFKQNQGSLSKEYPNLGVTELTKVAAKCWNELSTQQKEPFNRHCEEERKIYQLKMEQYKIDFPHEVAEKEKEKVGRRQPRKEKKNVKDTPRKEKGVQAEQNNQKGNKMVSIPLQDKADELMQDEDDSLGIV